MYEECIVSWKIYIHVRKSTKKILVKISEFGIKYFSFAIVYCFQIWGNDRVSAS